MKTVTRVRINDDVLARYNNRIRSEAVERLSRLERAGPGAIKRRLTQLDTEWDIERVVETNGSGLALGGLLLGKLLDRRFYLITAAVCGFLFQRALRGGRPLRFLRAAGVRTPREIEEERHALLERLGGRRRRR